MPFVFISFSQCVNAMTVIMATSFWTHYKKFFKRGYITIFTSKYKQSSKSVQLGSRLEETNSICQKAEATAMGGETDKRKSNLSDESNV